MQHAFKQCWASLNGLSSIRAAMLHSDGFSLLVGLGRMHVLTLMERAKTLCYLAIPRSCNRARESTRPQSRRLPVFNYIFIVLMYVIYIYSIIFYFFTGCACTQPPARRGQRTVALVHYGRERRAVGGSARHSAQVPKRPRSTASEPTVALHRSARVVHAGHVVH